MTKYCNHCGLYREVDEFDICQVCHNNVHDEEDTTEEEVIGAIEAGLLNHMDDNRSDVDDVSIPDNDVTFDGGDYGGGGATGEW